MKKLTFGVSSKCDVLFVSRPFDTLLSIISSHIECERFFIVTDDNLAKLYLDVFCEHARKSNITLLPIVVPAGEEYKSHLGAGLIYRKLAGHHAHKNDVCIAFGGGMIGDLVGFVASTYKRGMRLVNVPTSLIAQIDSAYGGKTAINFDGIKNLVGTFYHPELIVVLPAFLKSLSQAELLSGFGELVKYAAIEGLDLLSGVLPTNDLPLELLMKCYKIKADYVVCDENDNSTRRILNFGHTFGHAFEAASSYKLSHGEAVALGMLAACDFGEYKNLTCNAACQSLHSAVERFSLPSDYSHLAKKACFFLAHDKKTISSELIDFVYLSEIGKPFVKKTKLDELVAFLSYEQ